MRKSQGRMFWADRTAGAETRDSSEEGPCKEAKQVDEAGAKRAKEK